MDINYDALLAPKRITAVLTLIALCISAGLVLSVSVHASGDLVETYTTAQY